jgi:hypothetical protein
VGRKDRYIKSEERRKENEEKFFRERERVRKREIKREIQM